MVDVDSPGTCGILEKLRVTQEHAERESSLERIGKEEAPQSPSHAEDTKSAPMVETVKVPENRGNY